GRCFLRLGNFGVDVGCLTAERPIAPADDQDGPDEKRAAQHRHLLGRNRNRELLLRALAFGNEVDANHRSPAFRSANPTATAPVEASCCTSWMPSCCASQAIFLNGSNISTGALKRSSSDCMKPSTQAAPPLR